MQAIIWDDVPFQIDADRLLRRLLIDESEYIEEVDALADEAQAVARPRRSPVPMDDRRK